MRMLWCSILSAVLLVSLAQANPLSKRSAAEDSSDQSGSEAVNSLDSTKDGTTLPENVDPSGYTIKLEPHLDNDFTFSGESNIDVNIGIATSEIVLHAAGLKIQEDFTSLVDVEGDTPLNPTNHSLDADNELLTIKFAKPINAGTYTLNLKYTGTLETEPQGFYRSSRKIDQQDVWEAFTQFKPSHARRAFPCFDETAIEARFTISIKQPENYTVKSNVLKVSDTESENSWTQFITSELLSTDDIEFKVVYEATTTVAPTNTTTVAPTNTTTIAPTNTTTVAPTNTTTVAPTNTTTVAPTNTTTIAPTNTTTIAPTTTTTVAPTNTTTVASTNTTTVAPTNTTTDVPSGSSTTDEPSGSSTTDESSGSSTTDESSGSSTTDEPSGSSTTDESSGSSTTDESSGSSTTDESSGSSTTDTNGATAAPSTTGAANIALPTLPFTIFIGLLARLVVAQAL